jgi:hypothetical protein
MFNLPSIGCCAKRREEFFLLSSENARNYTSKWRCDSRWPLQVSFVQQTQPIQFTRTWKPLKTCHCNEKFWTCVWNETEKTTSFWLINKFVYFFSSVFFFCSHLFLWNWIQRKTLLILLVNKVVIGCFFSPSLIQIEMWVVWEKKQKPNFHKIFLFMYYGKYYGKPKTKRKIYQNWHDLYRLTKIFLRHAITKLLSKTKKKKEKDVYLWNDFIK